MKYGLLLLAWLVILPAGAQIVNIESKRLNNDTTGFDGQLEASVDLSQNNTFLFSANTKAQVQYKWKKDLILVLGDWRFSTGEGVRFMNDGMGHLRYNHKFLKWLRWEVFTQVQYNELLNVKLRFLAGTGPRFKLTPWEKYKLYAGTLYMFEYENVAVDDTLHLDHRMSAYLSWNLDPTGSFSFTGTTYYQPLFKDWADFRLAGMYSLRFKIIKRLMFKVDFNFLYDTRPPSNVSPVVYGMKTGVIFTFKP